MVTGEHNCARHGKDWRPCFKELFDERLECGQTFYTPCLGWKEFIPSYFGPLRTVTERDTNVEHVIPSFLRSMWEHHQLKPEYVQNWQIVKGVMSYMYQTPSEEELNVK